MSRFGSREIANVVLKDINTGKPVLYLESLKVSTMETGAETVYARGGSGNPKLIGWDSDREVTFQMEDALISPEALAKLAGNDVVTGAKPVHKKEVLTINGGVVTTSKVILTTQPIFVFTTERGSDIGTEITIDPATQITDNGTNSTIDLSTSGLSDGTKIIVDYYYQSPATTKTIKITSDKFPGYYKLEAETLWRRESDGKDFPALFTMPKIKIKSGFTITMEAGGEPSTFSFECDAFKASDSTDMVIIDVLEE